MKNNKGFKELKIEQRITSRSANVDRYFSDVHMGYTLSANEEYKIALKAAEGDREAIDTLVKANLRFVISVAKQYGSNPDLFAELIAQGNIGLIAAAKTFDPTRGFKFISYAVYHIRKEILKYFNDLQKPVRLPQNVTQDLNRAKKIESKMASVLGRDVTLDEITDEMTRQGWTITAARLASMRGASEKGVPLESNDPDEEWSPIGWLASGETAMHIVEKNDSAYLIERILSPLSLLERDIVQRKLGLITGQEETFLAIGTRYDHTSEWARQIYMRALKKAKRSSMSVSIKDNITE